MWRNVPSIASTRATGCSTSTPEECVDCGACEPVCPVEAIYYEDDLPEDQEEYLDINAQFFGRPRAHPAGSARLGPVDHDHPTVEQLPPQGE